MRVGKVAVIGAGVAGLTAAEEVTRRGAEVVVWDKRAEPGGPASSRRREGFEFDHGPQYFTGRDAELRSRLGVWIDEGAVARCWRYAIPAPPIPEPCLYDAELRLGPGGDWSGGSCIEAAFTSGSALASRVLGRSAGGAVAESPRPTR